MTTAANSPLKHPALAGGDPMAEVEQARALALRLRLPFRDLHDFRVEAELFRLIPVDLMIRHSFVPVAQNAESIEIVMADPTDIAVLDELESQVGKAVRVAVGLHSEISEILKKSESAQRVLDDATEDFKMQVIHEDEDGEQVVSADKLASDASPVIKLVDSIVFNALQRRASDIHIETRDIDVVVKYRIDGVLYPAMDAIDKKFHSAILSRIKVMSELDIAEKRVPQDGRFKLKIRGRMIDFRVSIMPCIHGEDAVIRILDKESADDKFKELRLDILGFDDETLRRVRRHTGEPYGMVLVTGPTGSGKTTTLYAALSEIKTDEFKIVTIEDPVEYQLRGVTQIPVNEKKGLTFARGLRSILRHDPDKIMIGEIRDEETAQIAIQSALTGHLVFTTVHANTVIDVLGRFLNMKVELYNFVSALNCVLAQRLIRKICPHCVQPVKIPVEKLRDAMIPEKYWQQEFREGRGCMECNGQGYIGRTAIAEVLEMTDTVREAILRRASAAEIKKIARSEGMHTLRESAVRRFIDGETTLKEINKMSFVEAVDL